jgi:uncharacterized RDD family membrane protein YckC
MPVAGAGLRRPRFLPEKEDELESHSSSILIDPETIDPSEQQFMASLEDAHSKICRSRFVFDQDDGQGRANLPEQVDLANTAEVESGDLALTHRELVGDCETNPAIPQPVSGAQEITDSAVNHCAAFAATDALLKSGGLTPEADSFWKDEVAARLSHYRARRKPRPPKYPSLRLKFDPTDRKSDPEVRSNTFGNVPATRESVAFLDAEGSSSIPCADATPPDILPSPIFPAETARIIEFPRSYYTAEVPPPPTGDELADPVLDRPRIVEVPDMDMPAPALGGIIIEPDEPEPERRPGFEIPLQTASKGRRLMASGCDAGIVLGACTLFGYIAFRIAGDLGAAPITTVGTLACVLVVLFWSAYQYLLLTYAGTTPGLQICHLRLCQFDGSAVDRRRRRWRVIASILSGLSLGLGYAWCFLDEDALCWHDRITRTYLEPLR